MTTPEAAPAPCDDDSRPQDEVAALDPGELTAYREGRLNLARFEELDALIARLPAEEQARLLGEPADWLVGLALVAPAPANALPVFATEPKRLRYRVLATIGAGGMGIVEAAFDEVLGREIALKRCRPRRPDESPATYAARLRAFKREAAITAQLEHPGIVPVHDVGSGALGEPAFVMKRLDGRPLEAMIADTRAGRPLDLASIAETLLRLSEAIAYAHSRGVVHRDLKPDNVIVGALGAVYVIDWGLAAILPVKGIPIAEAARSPGRRSEIHRDDSTHIPPASRPETGDAATTAGTFRLGTPSWMAPEQFGPSRPDPRMDVFALGGLLMALLTGHGPRDETRSQAAVLPSTDLRPLEARLLPRGLVAVARRCLLADPAQRYADGAAVAEELRHWLSAGLTQAERPSALTRVWAKVKRSPRAGAAALGVTLAVAGTLVAISQQGARQERRDLQEIRDLARKLDIGNEGDVHSARTRIQLILKEHPGMVEGAELLSRLSAAEDVFAAKAAQARIQDQLHQLDEQYLQKGPRPEQSHALLQVLRTAGYLAEPLDEETLQSEAAHLRVDPLAPGLLAALVRLERGLLLHSPPPALGQRIPQLIILTDLTPAWRATGEVLAQTSVQEHELLFPACPAAALALAQPETADELLSTYAPEARLIRVARERWHKDANAFWPRVISGRDCIANGEWREAERHALVALGREPQSLWPHLILAYVALADHDDQALLREAEAGLTQNPAHIELIILQAVALARTGHLAQAQAQIDQCADAQHLIYHLQHHSEHPMEHSVEALLAAGVRLPGADHWHHRIPPSAPPSAPAR